MSQKPSLDASQALIDLVLAAIKSATDTVATGEQLTPFVLTVGSDGAPQPILVVADRLEESVARARVLVEALPVEITLYVIAMEAYVTIEGVKYDAVLVEGGERGRPFALQFAQRYRPASQGAAFETVGNVAYLGQTEQRLKG